MKRIILLITSRTFWITSFSFSAFAVPASIYGFILRNYQVPAELSVWINALVFLIAIVINLIIVRKLFSFKKVGIQRKSFLRSFTYSLFFVLVIRLVPALISKESISGELNDLNKYLSLTPLVFSAFHEELLFRGVILRVWEKSKGFIAAVFVSTALFGLEHLIYPFWGLGDWSIYTLVRPTIFSPVFMLVAYRTKNIWGLALSHFLYNASIKLANGSSAPPADSPESYFVVLLGATLFLPVAIDSIDHRVFKTKQSKVNWHKFFSWILVIIFLWMLADAILNDLGVT